MMERRPRGRQLRLTKKWRGCDGAKAERTAAQVDEGLCDFVEFSHSDGKMLTENLSGYQQPFALDVKLVQSKNIKVTSDWVKDQGKVNKKPSIAELDEESFIEAIP
jgi:hypothetical protein